jgi:SAM-dependent methyltransferase
MQTLPFTNRSIIVGDATRVANNRRVRDPLFQRVFRGKGIDIGCGGDRLDRDGLFPNIASCDGFDIADGDAEEILKYLPRHSYDFVYSSHCLEHMRDPARAISNWFELVRPYGFLCVVIPDEDLYEQGVWPSRFNADHKWSFTFKKRRSWSPRSINVVEMILDNLLQFTLIRISLVDDQYEYNISGVDQSLGSAEVGIEFIIQRACLVESRDHVVEGSP